MFQKQSNWIPIYQYNYGYSHFLVQARIGSDGLITFKTKNMSRDDSGLRDLGLNPKEQFAKLIIQNK